MFERPLFKNRFEAGRQLAQTMSRFQGSDSLVLALARGGVPVGTVVADYLKLPLYPFMVRKLGAPGNPEFAIGAIAEGGVVVLNQPVIASLGIKEEALRDQVSRETLELERRLDMYRGNRHNLQVEGKTVILVDDGLATGATALAAVRALQMGNPREVILAVPVCAKETIEQLEQETTSVHCLHGLLGFSSVGEWYQEFRQVTDKEVVELLKQSRGKHDQHLRSVSTAL